MKWLSKFNKVNAIIFFLENVYSPTSRSIFASKVLPGRGRLKKASAESYTPPTFTYIALSKFQKVGIEVARTT